MHKQKLIIYCGGKLKLGQVTLYLFTQPSLWSSKLPHLNRLQHPFHGHLWVWWSKIIFSTWRFLILRGAWSFDRITVGLLHVGQGSYFTVWMQTLQSKCPFAHWYTGGCNFAKQQGHSNFRTFTDAMIWKIIHTLEEICEILKPNSGVCSPPSTKLSLTMTRLNCTREWGWRPRLWSIFLKTKITGRVERHKPQNFYSCSRFRSNVTEPLSLQNVEFCALLVWVLWALKSINSKTKQFSELARPLVVIF